MRRLVLTIAGLLLVGLPSALGYVVLPEQTCTPASVPGREGGPVSPARGAPADPSVSAGSSGSRSYLLPISLVSVMIFAAAVVVSQLGARVSHRISLFVPLDVKNRREFLRSWANDHAGAADRGPAVVSTGLAYGVIAALLPALCAVLALYLLSSCGGTLDDHKLRTSVLYATIGALGAALTSVLLSFAEFWARLAGRDLNDRAFDTGLRSLLLASLCAAAAGVVIGNRELVGNPWIEGPGDMMVVGIVTGIIGDYLFLATIEFVSLIFGHTSGLDEDIQSFIWIDGLDDQEGVRLREIGIRSAQALAFASPAFVFFRTRYPLARICDWQDQALLHVHLGQPLVQRLRAIYSFRGALDLLALLDNLHGGGVLTDSPSDVLVQLRLRLREQPQLTALAVWRRCSTIDARTASAGHTATRGSGRRVLSARGVGRLPRSQRRGLAPRGRRSALVMTAQPASP